VTLPSVCVVLPTREVLNALMRRELGIGHLLLEAQESRMDHPTTMRSIELMGAKVIPAMATV